MSAKKYLLSFSIMGTAMGAIALTKDKFSGVKYEGEEDILGKTAIITGANTGLGKETAMELAKRGGRIILACRDLKKCEETLDEIREQSFNKKLVCKKLDLASIDSIREFADDINKTERHLEYLVNNAGVMRCPKTTTQDGFEMQLGVNHLGHFLLTHLLLDKLKKSAPSRIVVLSSVAHKRGQINFSDLNSSKEYDAGSAYNQSKLANVLFVRELAKRLEGSGVTVNAVHPGLVKTDLFRHMSLHNSRLSSVILFPINYFLLAAPILGCQTILYAVLDPKLDSVSGKYFFNCAEKAVASQAEDDAVAKRLWAISEKWTRIS